MTNILFVNSTEQACGIYQFGTMVYENIKDSEKYNFLYHEIKDTDTFHKLVLKYRPRAVIYNFYPITMPWITHDLLNSYRGSFPQLALLFEVLITGFDYLIKPDPGFIEKDNIFKTTRPLAKFTGTYPKNKRTTIGSFGFAFGWKSFPELTKLVNEQFDDAVLNLQIPYAAFGDRDGSRAREVENICRSLITKPNITLNVTHEFLSREGILQFLANNDLNAFVADPEWRLPDDYEYSQAITDFPSSAPDLALSVKRPIAISRAKTTRHLFTIDDSICVENSSLKDILMRGTKPLEKFYQIFSQQNLIEDYERILDKVLR